MHCREEKIGLRTEKIFSPLLLLIFSFSLINAQINLKGFGKVEFQTTEKGNSKIYAYDYSEDGIDDLVLYGANEKKVILHPSEKSIYSKIPINKFFFYPLTEIKKFNKSGSIQTHLFISRSERKAGLFSFTKYGTMKLLNEIEFDSYPAGISTGNVNSGRNLEAIVFGANFNGISLLKQTDLKLEHEKIIDENSYSAAELVDLDYDGIKDLAALNLIENSIELYFTDPAGQFEFSRSISELAKINNFTVDDFNGDHFKDLILFESEGVKIFLGDSVSSFDNSIFIDKIKNSGKSSFLDINSDGWKDFLYFDTKTKLLSIQFIVDSKLDEKLSLHKFENIRDIIYYKDKTGKKFLILEDNGILIELGYLTTITQSEKLMFGADISALYVHDFFNKGRRDLFFIDSYERQLKCLVFDKQKLNSYYFSLPIPKKFNNLTGFPSLNSIDLLAYNLNEFLIQSISLDVSDSTYHLTPIYTSGEIRAVKPFGENNKKIAVIEKTDSSNQMNIYIEANNNWNKTTSRNIPFDFYSASIIDTSSFIYFNHIENNASITKADFIGNEILKTLISKFDIADNIIIHQKFIEKSGKYITSLFLSGGILQIDNYQLSKSKNEHKELNLKSFNLSPQLSFYFYKGKNSEFIFVNDTEKEILLIFKKALGTNKYIPSKTVESIACNSYFAASLFNNREYLVYIDKLTKTINFTGIDD